MVVNNNLPAGFGFITIMFYIANYLANSKHFKDGIFKMRKLLGKFALVVPGLFLLGLSGCGSE